MALFWLPFPPEIRRHFSPIISESGKKKYAGKTEGSQWGRRPGIILPKQCFIRLSSPLKAAIAKSATPVCSRNMLARILLRTPSEICTELMNGWLRIGVSVMDSFEVAALLELPQVCRMEHNDCTRSVTVKPKRLARMLVKLVPTALSSLRRSESRSNGTSLWMNLCRTLSRTGQIPNKYGLSSICASWSPWSDLFFNRSTSRGRYGSHWTVLLDGSHRVLSTPVNERVQSTQNH